MSMVDDHQLSRSRENHEQSQPHDERGVIVMSNNDWEQWPPIEGNATEPPILAIVMIVVAISGFVWYVLF